MADQSISIKVMADTKDVEKGMKKATSAVAKAANKITAISDVFKNIGKSMDTNAANPLKELGVNVEQLATIFDDSMSKVEAALDEKLGKSSKEAEENMQSLREEAERLGSTTMFSTSEAAEGMEKLTQAGWETHQILAGIGPILDLASQSAMDLATTIDLVTETLDMFNLTAEQASEVTDMFAFAQSNAGINVLALSEALKFVSESATIAGLSLAETTAIMGVFINAGLEGSIAGTVFTAMLQDLTNNATEAALAIGDMNIALYDAEGIMISMIDILIQLQEATSMMTDVQRELALGMIFSTEAMVGVNAVLEEGINTILEFTAGLTLTTETMVGTNFVLEQGTEILRNFTSALIVTMGAIVGVNAVYLENTDILRNLGEEINNTTDSNDNMISSFLENIPVIGDVSGLFMELFGSLLEVADGADDLVTGYEKLKNAKQFLSDTVIPDLKQTLTSVGTVLKSLGSAILPVVTTAVKALGTAFKSLAANPVGLVLTAIAAVIAIGILLWQNWDTVKEKAGAIWDWITDKIGDAKDKIKEIVDSVIDFFTGMKLDIPKPKLPSLPKFEITGKFSLTPPSIPKVSVGWHKDGGVFNGASIIGVGEAGTEAVVPLSGHRMNPFAQAIANEMPGNGSSGGGGVYEFNLSIPLDGRELARRTVRYTSEELERLRIRTKGSF